MLIIKKISDLGVGVMLPAFILLAGIYLTKYLGGFYLLHPLKTLKLMLSREGTGGTSPLRALSVSLAGTLGVGNIVGVAVAIVMGGAGALFWMWISAFFSMILKYAEIVLAMRYKIHKNNEIIGGPMYYMRDGIGGRSGRMFAGVFAALGLFSAFSMGNMVQMNAASSAVKSAFSVPTWLFGIVAAVFCAFLLLKGFRGISRVTSVLIPFLSALYFLMSARVVLLEWERLPALLFMIWEEAFSVSSASGGVMGFLLSGAIRQGVAKGSFSHEAGCGTAPMAHAGADTKIPAKQGVLGIFEVFFDTILLCTLTGFVILLASDGELITDNGMHLVIYSFARYYGKYAAYFISFSIVLFAIATVICWGYYGKVCLSYLVRSENAGKIYDLAYSAVTVLAAVMSESAVWELSDITVALMTVINLTAVLWLRREVKEETAFIFGEK
jgi:AGCS family alanine or glycine:cation symporter